ncbi:MAG: hypothetical protein NUV65_03325 [Candidatus Roizmanbacteria bacterium]|nr:hypothetical protein [Candidatus Roizmanbacteria bacterium]
MHHIKHAIFLGKNGEGSVTFFIAQQQVYIVGEVVGENATEQAKSISEKVRSELLYLTISNSQTLVELIEKAVGEEQDISVSWSALSLSQDVSYVATNMGSVLMHDKNVLYCACSQNEHKQGPIKPNTTFFLITPQLTKMLTTIETHLKNAPHPKLITDALYENIPEDQQVGAACIVLYIEKEEQSVSQNEPEIEPVTTRFSIQPRYLKGAIALVVLIAIVFVAGKFVFGMIETKRNESINLAITTIGKSVDALSASSTKDPQKLAGDITKLETQIKQLTSKKLNPSQASSVQTLNTKIKDAKSTVGNVQISKEELFFDIKLIHKDAQISTMTIVNGTAVMLDKKRNKIYTLELATKNKNEFTPKTGTTPLFASLVQDSVVYIDIKNGIYKETGGAFEKIVSKEDWGTLKGLETFNSNIYTLDATRDEIYKYTPVEDGYSSKLSYFQPGSALDLARAKQMAIDYYVYLLTNDALYKFNGGVREDFSISGKIQLSDVQSIYTDSDSSFLYLLDPTHTRVIVLDKKGATVRSIFNPLLKDARYFGVHKDTRLVFLYNNKLYMLDNL